MHRILAGLMLAMMVCFGPRAWAADLQEGRDYQVLSPAQPTSNPGKVVVTEFFSYQCPHCFAFFPSLDAWTAKLPADVQFERESISLGYEAWQASARTFYTLQAMDKLKTLDAAIFRAVHEQHVKLLDEDSNANWLATKGIKPEDFHAAYKSFGVDAKWKRGEHLSMTHKVPSIPCIVIDGRYLMVIAGNVDYGKQLANVDALIAKARAEKKAKH